MNENVLFFFLVFGVASAFPLATADTKADQPAFLSATLVGFPEKIFDTRDACEPDDIPDENTRAFRDDKNIVHLINTHHIARAMVGATLDTVRHDCHVIYNSPEDPDPSHFQDFNWLTSFWTEDGRYIASLVHSEYHGWTHPGMCTVSVDPAKFGGHCWWNSITLATSNDGGYSFAEPPPPKNLVASVPYAYDRDNRVGAIGYQSPTNIIKVGAFYYAMINDWPYEAQHAGACLMRTSNPFDPKSWRAWDGHTFGVTFIDPYTTPRVKPEDHVCLPVAPGEVTGLSILQGDGSFVVTAFTPDKRFGPLGFYLMTSVDLIHWSKPILVVTTDELLAQEGPGKWAYGYFTLLDPAAQDRNFATITDAPYVYYVRFDENHPPMTRVLFRRRLNLHRTDSH